MGFESHHALARGIGHARKRATDETRIKHGSNTQKTEGRDCSIGNCLAEWRSGPLRACSMVNEIEG